MCRRHETILYPTENPAVLLRPHHGMCLAYFRGYGYSDEFGRHMGEMLKIFEKNIPVILTCAVDEICSACPNNQDHLCTEARRVEQFDRGVLELCGLEEGKEMLFLDFVKKVQKRILSSGRRPQICGNCRWNEICSSGKSRWE